MFQANFIYYHPLSLVANVISQKNCRKKLSLTFYVLLKRLDCGHAWVTRLVRKRKKEKRIKSSFNQIEISVNVNEWFNVCHGS